MNGIETGVDFNFSFAPGITDEQILGFEMAGQIWSHYLRDDATINIHVETTNQLPENVIGGALPGMKKNVHYEKLWKEMSEDITSSDDLTAFNNRISADKEFTGLVNGQEITKVKDLKLTNANAKALDLIDGDSDKLDGYILMSDLSGQSNVQWDYNSLRNENIAADSLDFLSVALHEVGHILGFVSGIDDGGWLNVVTEAAEKGKDIKDDAMKFATALDLFRYSSKDRIDFSMGGNSFFSIDGGQTNLGYFSTGEYSDLGGDGYQASHWKHDSDNPLGIMDPVLKMGLRRDVSNLDTKAMDVMGWDVTNSGQLNWQQLYDNAIENAKDALIEDRTKDVEKMVKQSDTYHGRRSRSSSSGGSWQIGIWQNIKFQTLDVEVESNVFQPEFNLADILIDRYLSEFDSSLTTQNESNDESVENTIDNQPDVEEMVVQLMHNSEIVASESRDIDLDLLGRLLSEKLEDIFNVNDELGVMPITR